MFSYQLWADFWFFQYMKWAWQNKFCIWIICGRAFFTLCRNLVFKGHPHVRIIYQVFSPHFIAVWSKCISRLSECQDRCRNLARIWVLIRTCGWGLKGHPHAGIMYPRFWAESLAVWSKYYGGLREYYGELREFPDKNSNFGLLYGRVRPLQWHSMSGQDLGTLYGRVYGI